MYSDSRKRRVRAAVCGKQVLPKPQTAVNIALMSTIPHHATVGQPSHISSGYRYKNACWFPDPNHFPAQGPARNAFLEYRHYHVTSAHMQTVGYPVRTMWLDPRTKSTASRPTTTAHIRQNDPYQYSCQGQVSAVHTRRQERRYRPNHVSVENSRQHGRYGQNHVTTAKPRVRIEVLDHGNDDRVTKRATEPVRKVSYEVRKSRCNDHQRPMGLVAESAHGETRQVPTDEQLWGNSLKCSTLLRNHLRSAFHPKRWPAFCKSKSYLLPHFYKPGCGLGLVDPKSGSLNAGVITGFVEFLIMTGETRNVAIHCVSFLQQMTVMEATQRYQLSLPEKFHIIRIVPRINDLLRTGPFRKILKSTDTPDTRKQPSRMMDANAREGFSDGRRLSGKLPRSFVPEPEQQHRLVMPAAVDDLPKIPEASIGGSEVPCAAYRKGSLSKEKLRASLMDLSEKVDEVLSTRLGFVDGELVQITK